MPEIKEERRGGVRDEGEIYINYTIDEFMRMLARQKRHFRAIGKPKIRNSKKSDYGRR